MARARAAWAHLQLLGEPANNTREALLRAGWLHAIGGADGYVSLWSRVRDFKRADVEDPLREGRLWIAPGVRGCTMLVPREELGLALLVGTRDARRRTERELAKAKVETSEVEALCDAVRAALAEAPKSTSDLRGALPAGAVRSLGEVGRKIGLSSTLPVALRLLEADGVIGRRAADGELDNERWIWSLHESSPLAAWSPEPTQVAMELASRYFRQAAPATVRGFATWSGLGLRECQAAVQTLGLAPVAVEGGAELGYAPESLLPLLADPPAAPSVAFVAFRDNHLDMRLGVTALVAPASWGRQAPSWGSGRTTLQAVKHLHGRGLLGEGALVGMWDYDAERGVLLRGAFGALPRATRRDLAGRCLALEHFLRDQVGHCLIYRMEPQRSREQRLAAIRALESC
ncbi:MAG: winged helix DNA-binding domain-containing protein [Myxococcales bacterium]|nr:winged helix DNA-binding domain-containing protein [Myxococcales bacterium]